MVDNEQVIKLNKSKDQQVKWLLFDGYGFSCLSELYNELCSFIKPV